jgi:4-hydroxybenzoyl-CoA thioesterase
MGPFSSDRRKFPVGMNALRLVARFDMDCHPRFIPYLGASGWFGAMASLVSRRQFTIEWAHCDPAGIVFNSRFFEYFDWGTWTLFEVALGVKPPDLASTFGIVGLPLVDAGAKFLAPARFGDVVDVTSQVSEFRRSSFDVAHRLLIGGEVAVEGHETRVWAIRDPAHPSQIRAEPIPAHVIERFDRT